MILAGIIAAVVAVWLIWKRKMPKTTTLLALLAGAGLTIGWLGRGTDAVVDWGVNFADTLTRSAAGQAVGWVVAIPVFLNVVHDLMPKNAANRVTFACAFFLPPLAAVLPGPIGDAVRSAIGGLAGMSADAVNATVQG
jgi:hypothetical protein